MNPEKVGPRPMDPEKVGTRPMDPEKVGPRPMSLLASHQPRMRRLALIAIAFGLVLLAAPPAQAHFKMHCKPETGQTEADPIVFAGMENPSGHLHTFLANEYLPDQPNPNIVPYAQMVGKPTTCQFAPDSAAYWFPTLLQNGNPLPVFRFIAYYRSWQFTAGGGEFVTGSGNKPYPPDTRMIAGDMSAPGGGNHVSWNCNQSSTRPGPYVDPIDAACDTAQVTGSTGKVLLGAHVDFPTCYSGTLNDHSGPGMTADFSGSHAIRQQFAYPRKAQSGTISCPAGFRIKVPALRLKISWDYQGDGRDLELSSHGFSMHADFWNTWVQSGLRRAIDGCINTTTDHPHGSTTICGS
jgi:hypothetical protein